MNVTLRPFSALDYPTFTQLKNIVYPDHPTTEELVRFQDSLREPHCRALRFLAEEGDVLVGAGEYRQPPWTYQPHHFELDFLVRPGYRRQGTGRALYQLVRSSLAPFQPQQLSSRAHAKQESGLAFLAHLGFRPDVKEWDLIMDPAGFDPTPYAGLEERLAAEGITITTMSALMAQDPAYREKLYALETHDDDDPGLAISPPSFDLFQLSIFDPAIFRPDAFFVAVKAGEYLGMSSLETTGDPGRLEVGYTGVAPAYRRRGIALALKLRTIQYAQAHGNPLIVTTNHATNDPMLTLNQKVGFRPYPGWISHVKEINTP